MIRTILLALAIVLAAGAPSLAQKAKPVDGAKIEKRLLAIGAEKVVVKPGPEGSVAVQGLFGKKWKRKVSALCFELFKMCTDLCEELNDMNLGIASAGDGFSVAGTVSSFAGPTSGGAAAYNACVANCREEWNACKP